MRWLLFVAATLLLLPYGGMLAALWGSGSKDAAASAVAFAGALVVGWQRRAALRRLPPPARPAAATAVLAIAAAVYVLSVFADLRVGVGAGATAVVAALLALRGGFAAWRLLALPLSLLALATPVPGRLLDAAGAGCLALAAAVAAPLLALLAGPVQRDGYLLHLPGGSVSIVEDCSGLGGVLLFVPLALLLGHAHGPLSPWRVLVLLPVAVAAALAGNLVRIVVSALLVHWHSPLDHAGWFHETLGVGSLLLALLVLLLAVRRLYRLREAGGAA